MNSDRKQSAPQADQTDGDQGTNAVTRSTFLKRVLASLLFMQLGRRSLALDLARPAEATTAPSIPILDLHCHPPLKYYLWGRKLWQHHPSRAGANIANMQVDILKLEAGGVTGLTAVHYLPEQGLVKQAGTLRKVFPKLRFLFPVFVEKLEQGGSANYRQMNTMIDDFEEQVRLTNIKHNGKKIRIAKRYSEFEQIMAAGDIAMAHAIEGAHALGRELSSDNGDKYIEHLDYFIDRGVCMMTLAHFFENDVVAPVEGIPPIMKERLRLNWQFDPQEDDKPLTPVGKRVVDRMLQQGMVVDLTHSTPAARKDVYELNKKYSRPLVFSHVGVRANFMGPHHYQYMAPDDDEIRTIAQCGGVIGVIFMNFWLSGCEMHAEGCPKGLVRNGIEEVLATIGHIRKITGNYDHIAIGSDFDGLADSPNDLRDHSCMDVLRKALNDIPGITPIEVEKILFRNSLRVLKNGWRN